MNKKIGIRTRKKQYQEKYNRKFPKRWFKYCKESLEDIQNWDKMLNDTSNTRWHLHHRDEIQGDVVVSKKELKRLGKYYNLSANKLIFITESEHMSLHKTGDKHHMSGKQHTEETKKKMSEAKKGDKHPMFGKTHTEEAKKKMRDANIGKKMSEETKNKISEALKGKMCGENNPVSKKIEIHGITYCSIEAAANDFGVHRRTIHNWLKNGRAKYI